jgi:hypothetical protein
MTFLGFIRHRRTTLAVSSVVIAGCSLVVAVCSLFLTIRSQKEDQFYKELSIKPSLAFVVRASDLSVSFVNDGLGAAEIKEAVYSVDGKCMRLYKAGAVDHEKRVIEHEGEGQHPGSVDQENARVAVTSLRKKLLTEVQALENAQIQTRSQILVPTIMRVGGEVVLFGLDDSSLVAYHTWLRTLNAQFAQSLLDNFTDRAMALPLSVRYCSLSGGYCRDVIRKGDASEACPLL